MSWDIEHSIQACVHDLENTGAKTEDIVRKYMLAARDELQKEARLVFTKVSRLHALIDLLTHPASKILHTEKGEVFVANPAMPMGAVKDRDFVPVKVEGQAELPLAAAPTPAAEAPPATQAASTAAPEAQAQAPVANDTAANANTEPKSIN